MASCLITIPTILGSPEAWILGFHNQQAAGAMIQNAGSEERSPMTDILAESSWAQYTMLQASVSLLISGNENSTQE